MNPGLTRIHAGRIAMFVFYSSRLGCLGSIALSVVATILLVLALRGCNP